MTATPTGQVPQARRGAEGAPQVRSQVVKQTFNHGLSAKDPAEFLGNWLGGFAVNLVLPLPEDSSARSEELRGMVYATVEQRLLARRIGPVQHQVIDFKDSKLPAELARRYIRVRLNTARDNEINTLFRCFTTGTNLYVAADSYRLGRINVAAVALRALLSLVGLSWALASITSVLALVVWPLVAGLLWWCWWDVLRASRGSGLSTGLRATYPRPLSNSSFDLDDSLMFLKSLLPMLLGVLKDVGPRYGLDLKSTEDLLEDLGRKVSTQTINVTNSGTMSGVAVGGIGNIAGSR